MATDPGLARLVAAGLGIGPLSVTPESKRKGPSIPGSSTFWIGWATL